MPSEPASARHEIVAAAQLRAGVLDRAEQAACMVVSGEVAQARAVIGA
jgi:phosphoribosylaminoimidazole (AIR) synthetase